MKTYVLVPMRRGDRYYDILSDLRKCDPTYTSCRVNLNGLHDVFAIEYKLNEIDVLMIKLKYDFATAPKSNSNTLPYILTSDYSLIA